MLPLMPIYFKYYPFYTVILAFLIPNECLVLLNAYLLIKPEKSLIIIKVKQFIMNFDSLVWCLPLVATTLWHLLMKPWAAFLIRSSVMWTSQVWLILSTSSCLVMGMGWENTCCCNSSNHSKIISIFIPTFITPHTQKSKGAKSGELGLQDMPPQPSDPRAKVLVPKVDWI